MLPPMNLPNTPAAPAAKPDPAESLARAEQAMKARRLGEAMGICQDILETQPDHPAALAMLGSIMGHRGEVDEGIQKLRRACELVTNNASWFSNLSSLCRIACRLDEALTAIERALALSPKHPSLLLSLAKLRMDRGEYEVAIAAFLDVLAREPENPEAHLAIGQIQLMHGQTRPGWYEYEWRNRLEQARGSIPDMSRPQWNGMRLPNDAILLIGDQGYGDTLQFARFIPLVAERCARVLLGCAPDLTALLAPIPGVHASFTRWQDIPKHAVYCRLSSVPALVGVEMDALPGKMPYIFADPASVAAWRERLDGRLGVRQPGDRPRVGVVWAGRPTHPNDRRRSLRLAQLAPILATPGVAFVSLQKVVPARDAAGFAALGNVLDVAADLTDFSATAGLIANLDLVITVDSSVAHLAGSMGRPVWVLAPRPSDWRWMLERSDSPWYPSLRLFRQAVAGDWDSAITAVAAELSGLTRASRPALREVERAASD
jgi:Flp pilus assembly protein TadD